jgi:glycosyltransferase involved in cell wall biosynthesis
MRVLIIADAFPPLRTSAAVQVRDLAGEFVRQEHHVIVVVPDPEINEPWCFEDYRGITVFRAKTPMFKNVGHVRRTLAEIAIPFFVKRRLNQSGFLAMPLDGIIWYSPTIFFGPLIHWLKQRYACRSFLILRDIFPEWAVDMGLMKRGIIYRMFKFAEKAQYLAADTIGIQSTSGYSYLQSFLGSRTPEIQLLRNWLTNTPQKLSSIRIDETRLRGRKICVYTGNMGVAQDVDIFIDLAARFKHREDVGFLFVGRGSETNRLKARAEKEALNNVLFVPEIHPDEISDLLSQCHVGLLALDPRHKTDNIPGKFLTYMRDGLPTLACVNACSELIDTIRENDLGFV